MMKTLDEWFPDGLGDRRKFTVPNWRAHEYIIPLAKIRGSRWLYLNELGMVSEFSGEGLYYKLSMWRPAKKTVTNNYWLAGVRGERR